jgi:hypothetical protein
MARLTACLILSAAIKKKYLKQKSRIKTHILIRDFCFNAGSKIKQ